MMCAMLRMAPLFYGMVLLLERTKCPLALLFAFGLLRYLVSPCAASTISLALFLVFPDSWVGGGSIPKFFLLDLPIATLWRWLDTLECCPLLFLGIGTFHTLDGWTFLFWRRPLEILMLALHIVPSCRIWLVCMDRASVVLFVLHVGKILVPF